MTFGGEASSSKKNARGATDTGYRRLKAFLRSGELRGARCHSMVQGTEAWGVLETTNMAHGSELLDDPWHGNQAT